MYEEWNQSFLEYARTGHRFSRHEFGRGLRQRRSLLRGKIALKLGHRFVRRKVARKNTEQLVEYRGASDLHVRRLLWKVSTLLLDRVFITFPIPRSLSNLLRSSAWRGFRFFVLEAERQPIKRALLSG